MLETYSVLLLNYVLLLLFLFYNLIFFFFNVLYIFTLYYNLILVCIIIYVDILKCTQHSFMRSSFVYELQVNLFSPYFSSASKFGCNDAYCTQHSLMWSSFVWTTGQPFFLYFSSASKFDCNDAYMYMNYCCEQP